MSERKLILEIADAFHEDCAVPAVSARFDQHLAILDNFLARLPDDSLSAFIKQIDDKQMPSDAILQAVVFKLAWAGLGSRLAAIREASLLEN